MNHLDCITHIDNNEDLVYLRTTHFPVNMRLFRTSPRYRDLILHHCKYIEELCLEEKPGYKKPHGMSSANAGLAFNIIGITKNRGLPGEYCQIMINPQIIMDSSETEVALSNCGSLTLPAPIEVRRYKEIKVRYFDVNGDLHTQDFTRDTGGFTIQHEIDHNNGILITDRAEAE